MASLSASFLRATSRLVPVSMSAEIAVDSALTDVFPALHKAFPARIVNRAATGLRSEKSAFSEMNASTPMSAMISPARLAGSVNEPSGAVRVTNSLASH